MSAAREFVATFLRVFAMFILAPVTLASLVHHPAAGMVAAGAVAALFVAAGVDRVRGTRQTGGKW